MGKAIDKLEFWKHRIDNAAAKHYSVYVIHEPGWKRIYEVHKELISNHIKPTDKVLDAGCGYGRMSVLFNDYTGIDFSPDFIKLAKQEYPNRNFQVANLKALPFKDKEFDWSFCVSIKRMVEDNLGKEEWNMMEKELKRVSKKVLILEYEDPTQYEVL